MLMEGDVTSWSTHMRNALTGEGIYTAISSDDQLLNISGKMYFGVSGTPTSPKPSGLSPGIWQFGSSRLTFSRYVGHMLHSDVFSFGILTCGGQGLWHVIH
jgi:hypothetical protein